MSEVAVFFLHGLAYAGLLFLVSSGLTLVFGMMNVLNFAHASFYMLGAYFAFSLMRFSGNFWLALLVSPLLLFVLGAASMTGEKCTKSFFRTCANTGTQSFALANWVAQLGLTKVFTITQDYSFGRQATEAFVKKQPVWIAPVVAENPSLNMLTWDRQVR
jgi:branched-subunit amino acid ABC-type transport system permease component